MKGIKYIQDKQELGIKYDWTAIRKEYKKLGCPDIYYNPCVCPFETCKYFVEFSQRSIGKTTNWLLLGMVMNSMYGTIMQYLRQTDEQIAPKTTKNMFDPIIQCGYIPKITKNRWNSVFYKSRRWYYCNVDLDGKITEIAPEHFCMMMVVTKNETYKSGYNAPKGDFIIYDEFINKFYYPDEFVQFCDLIKTIIRDRQSPIVVMLSNNTDKESTFFSELEIYDEVRTMPPGSHLEKTTLGGTRIYIEYITADKIKQKRLTVLNNLFFGFKNKRLGSITGEDWALKPAQRMPRGDYDILVRNLYLYHNNRYQRFDVVHHEKLGLCLYIHWAKEPYEDSVIMTMADRYDNRYQYGLGRRKLESFIYKMKDENRIYYSSNDVFAFFNNYLKEYEKST